MKSKMDNYLSKEELNIEIAQQNNSKQYSNDINEKMYHKFNDYSDEVCLNSFDRKEGGA